MLADVSARRKKEVLSPLEVKGILRRNSLPGSGYISLKTLEDVESAKRFIRLSKISTPVYDINTELMKRKSSTWKHLEESSTTQQNKEQMRLHYQGTKEKRFFDFIKSSRTSGFLKDTGLVNIDPCKLQEILDVNQKRKHKRVPRRKFSKKRRRELI